MPVQGNNAVQRWNKKLIALRRYLRGWAKHKFGVYTHTKVSLQQTIEQLDTTAESRNLIPEENLLLSQARDQLAKLHREEEIKFFQKPK
jgi:hypothetical protein